MNNQEVVPEFLFCGTYVHKTDDKARVILPYEFRTSLGPEFHVVCGPDGRLCVMHTARFNQLKQESTKPFPSIIRMYLPAVDKVIHQNLAKAVRTKTDPQSRMVINDLQQKHSGIEPRCMVVITGVGDWIEVWEKRRYDEYEKGLDEESVRKAALFVDEFSRELARERYGAVSRPGAAPADAGAPGSEAG